ncbi:MAG: YfhO family protein [Thermomicrobiales bacterium]|nr:YfhO family protein [Thermomicrobiales bacterium]
MSAAGATQERGPGSRPPADYRLIAPALADFMALAALLILTVVVAANRFTFDSWLTRLDLLTFFLPWYTFLGDRLRDLAVPGWNPHLFSGAPFAGDPESGWMYAPAMAAFTLIGEATAAFKAMVGLHLLIAGFTTYAFARTLGLGAFASLTAAALYITGPFLHWTTHCCLIFSQFATWVPLSLLGVELAVRASRWRERVLPWFLTGFAISQMVAGWIGEGWLYAFLLPAAYLAYRSLLSPPRPGVALEQRFWRGVVTGGAALGLGAALGAAGMLPRYIINAEMNLAGGDYSQVAGSGVLNPPWTLEYLLAQTLGVGSGYHYRAAAFGGVVIVLALLALPLVQARFAAPFFAALTLCAMILTLDTTPLHYLFYLIPRFQAFHEHDAWRTMSLAAIGPALLAAAAIEGLPAWRRQRRLLPVVVAPFVLLLAVAALLQQQGIWLGWPPLLAAGIATLLLVIYVAAPAPEVMQIVPPLLLATALVFPTGLELTATWLGWPRDDAIAWQLGRDPAAAAALAREVRHAEPGGAGEFLQAQQLASGPFRYVGYGGFGYPGDETRRRSYMERRLDPAVQSLLVNGRAIFLNLDEIQGYNPLQLQRYVDFVAAMNGEQQDYHTAFLLPSGTGSPLLDLLNTRFVLVDASLPQDRDDVAALRAGRREVFRNNEVIIYETEDLPGRAWIVHEAQAVAPGEALPLLSSGVVDPTVTALLEGPVPPVAPATGDSDVARVTRVDADGLTLSTTSTADSVLVISEVYANGWRAWVDGAETPVLPAFHTLQGIALPAGDHEVVLRYDPLSLRVGLWLSGAAFAAFLAAALWRLWAHLRGDQV